MMTTETALRGLQRAVAESSWRAWLRVAEVAVAVGAQTQPLVVELPVAAAATVEVEVGVVAAVVAVVVVAGGIKFDAADE